MIGSALGHYRILAKLGEGGMGIVYLAEDDRLRRKVALKMLPPGLSSDPVRLARFEREVKTVAALNHPNIVTIYSVEEEGGQRFFTMEHIEGRTLAQSIPLDGLPLPEFLKIAVPLADALTAAHARGIQHRDLKPSNVMVTSEGRVKVLDFGLARLKEIDRTEAFAFKPETTLTQAGLALGTLAYMSPEQLRMQATDHRSDLFSLGVVLFEMASGHCPFLGQSTAEVISSILRDQPARVYEANENVPEQLDGILRRCLEKDPAKRWQSAAELRDALAAVATEVSFLTTASRRPKAAAATPPWRSRKALGAAGVALAVLVTAVVAAFVIFRGGESRQAATTAAALATVPSIAVLPLTSFSGEPEYFVDGITDALISSLARIRGLRVISRQSAMHYKGSKKLLPEIAKELGVDYVVEGSVARDGESVRLSAQVIRADPETTLWSESFERRSEEVLALESSFTTAVATAINVKLSAAEQSLIGRAREVDPAAYEAYLQGKFFSMRFGEEPLRRALGHFERSVAADPSFAPAWVGLAETLQTLAVFHENPQTNRPQAAAALSRALELDPALAEAHAIQADLLQGEFRWAEAEAAARRAIELNPGSPVARRRYWMLLACQLRHDEALEEIQIARRLDPLSASIAANVGVQLLFMERHEEAIAALRGALELDPTYALAHVYLYLAYSELEKDPERGEELRFYIADLGRPELLPELEQRLESSGHTAALRWLANTLSDHPPAGPGLRYGLIAGLLAQAGESDKALSWLERGFEAKSWDLGWIAVSPDYKSLRNDPRFQSLLRRLDLPSPAT